MWQFVESYGLSIGNIFTSEVNNSMRKGVLKYLFLYPLILITVFGTYGLNWAGENESLIYQKAEIYLKNGIEFANQGRYEKAIKELEKALKIDDTNINALCVLGTVYIYNGMYEEAINTLENAITIDPEASVPRYVLAMAYEKQGANTKSIIQWNEFIGLSSNTELIKAAKKHIERLEELEQENE